MTNIASSTTRPEEPTDRDRSQDVDMSGIISPYACMYGIGNLKIEKLQNRHTLERKKKKNRPRHKFETIAKHWTIVCLDPFFPRENKYVIAYAQKNSLLPKLVLCDCGLKKIGFLKRIKFQRIQVERKSKVNNEICNNNTTSTERHR